jgi:hypothetical protein
MFATMPRVGPGQCSQHSDWLWIALSRIWIWTRARDFPWPLRQALGPTEPLYSGYDISFLELKCPEHGINHPPTCSTENEEKVVKYLWPPSVSSTLYQKNVGGPFPQAKWVKNTCCLTHWAAHNKLLGPQGTWKSSHFLWILKGSSLCSQEPGICTHTKADQSSPYPRILFLESPF